MDKKRRYGYILLVLTFAIYVTAAMPFPKTILWGIAFVFSMAAFFYGFAAVYFFRKEQESGGDWIYGFPFLRVGVLYLIVQIVVSLFFMAWQKKVSIFAVVLVELILLAAAAAGHFAVRTAGKEIIRQDRQLGEKLALMEELLGRIDRLITQCEDERIRESLQKLRDDVKYCTPVSGDRLDEIEGEIVELFSEIEGMTLAGDSENTDILCGRMRGLLQERENRCRQRN